MRPTKIDASRELRHPTFLSFERVPSRYTFNDFHVQQASQFAVRGCLLFQHPLEVKEHDSHLLKSKLNDVLSTRKTLARRAQSNPMSSPVALLFRSCHCFL